MGAEKAGLKEEDIITVVDDIKIKSFSNLTGYLESKHPGDKVNVEYYRNGKVNNTVITLNVINQTNFLRMTLQNISKEEKEKKNLKYGLRVLDSGDYMTELNSDSVLLEVNDNPLYTIDDLRQYNFNNIRNLEYLNPKGEKERISFRR
jgi:PDZ domain-containing secreted protein